MIPVTPQSWFVVAGATMASPCSEEKVDYEGPPPDPPPTGPVLSSSQEYGPPPRPAGWREKAGDGSGTASQEKGDEAGEGSTSTSQAGDGAGQAGGGAGQVGSQYSPSEECEGPSGAVPLLSEDVPDIFRRMAAMEDWEDRQALLEEGRCPSGSGEAALSLGSSLLLWKRLLGLAAPGGWREEYHMPSDPPGDEPQPPILCKLLTSAWVLAGMVLILASIGLQWAFCEREYYDRLQVWPVAASNSSSKEYLCVPSFLWTFLVPRLLFIFGYVTVFACIFCLRQPDFEFIVARAYDMVTEDRQNWSITSLFIDFCRRDPRLFAFWFVIIQVLSLVGSLLGEDIVRWDLTEAKPPPSSTLEWAMYVITCVVRLMIDSMIGHCIISYSLSVKYLELMVHRATWHLQTLVTQRNSLAACQYFFTRVKMVAHCVRAAQPCASAAVLMVLLRVCQVVSLVWVDQTRQPRRRTSLAQLPIAVLLCGLLLHHIRRNISLTETWQLQLDRGPNISLTPRDERQPDTHDTIHEFSEEEERNRATVLWYQIVRQCPQVAGRVMGLKAGHWMYWAVLVIGTLYCAGYYALLKHTPLI